MAEHDVTQSADCHEPLGITISTTADTGKVMTPSGSVSGTSELRKIKATELDTTGGTESEVLTVISGVPVWKAGNAVYGGMKLNDGSGTLGSIGTTPIKFAIFDAAMPTNGVTASTANDDLTISIAGDYQVSFHGSLSTVAVGDSGDYILHLRVNGSEFGISTHRDLSGTDDEGTMSFGGIATLAASDVITVFIESDSAGSDDINILTSQFYVHLLKEAQYGKGKRSQAVFQLY